jgi:hypothetical protein
VQAVFNENWYHSVYFIELPKSKVIQVKVIRFRIFSFIVYNFDSAPKLIVKLSENDFENKTIKTFV